MKFSFEVPINSLEALDSEQDYIYVLAQFMKNKKYKDYVMNTKKEVYLDNGASELKQSIDIYEYKKIVDELKPNVIIIPDVLFDRKKSNILGKKFMKLFTAEEKKKYKFMRVVQGNTTKEYCKSLLETINDYDVDIIGLSRSRRLITFGYSYIFNFIAKNYIGTRDLKIHILGTENPLELEEFAMYNGIKKIEIISTDTSLPINYATVNQTFPKIESYREFKRVKGVDLKWKGNLDIKLTKLNIRTFKSYANR